MTQPATTSAPRARRPRDRKQQIVLAASRLFRDKGFHNISMADVAAEVGITAGALYRHFKSKDDLLFQAVVDGLDLMDAVARDAGDMESYLRAAGTLALERRGLPALWQREARHLPDEKRAFLRQRLAEVAARVTMLVARERPKLRLSDVELLTWAMFAAFGSFGLHRITLAKHAFLRVHYDLNFRVVHADLGTDGAAPRRGSEPEPPKYAGVGLPRREQLISHAIRLFDERGFQSVRMDAIGAAAGITGSSVYKHFPTKEDLLSAALLRGDEQLRLGMTRALSTGEDPAQALDLLLRSHTEFALANSRLMGVLTSERAELPEKARKISYRSQRDYLNVWIGLLQECRPDLSADVAKMVVDAVFTVTNSLVRMRVLRERPDLGERIVDLNSALLGYDGRSEEAAADLSSVQRKGRRQ